MISLFFLQKVVLLKSWGTDSKYVLLLSLYIFFSSLSSVLMKEIVPLKNWCGTVVGQSEVALSSYKRGGGGMRRC